jgi:DNA-directed RNA polymerase subunit RPC12/RpoP
MISSPEIIDARMAVCSSCDKTKDMSEDPLYFFVNAAGKLIDDAPKIMCTECSCPIWVKVRVPVNTCPLNKWSE